MTIITANEHIMQAAVFGGSLLGGGGGGKIEEGLERGRLALRRGRVRIVSVDELDPKDIVVTMSSVGAPKAENRYLEPDYYVRALEVFMEQYPHQVKGVISCENGAAASVNGWLQSATLGVDVVDAATNGRAHPVSLMGAMGLHLLADYTSHLGVVGGNPPLHKYFSFYYAGDLSSGGDIVRHAAAVAGGGVAVARNPVTASYLREHAAIGALSYAIGIGEAMLSVWGRPEEMIAAAAQAAGGTVCTCGSVRRVEIETRNALDIGAITIRDDQGDLRLDVVNEYLTLDRAGRRLTTFPDLISLLDMRTGLPVPSAMVEAGQQVAVVVVPARAIPLGAGMRDLSLYRDLEKKTGVSLGLTDN